MGGDVVEESQRQQVDVGKSFNVVRLVCAACGYVVKPGELPRTCPECGGGRFDWVEDSDEQVTAVRCES